MITVTVDDQPIDLKESTSFSIGARSPFTSPGELWGPKVYNVAARDSRRNNRVFKFSKILNNTSRVKSYPNTRIAFGDLLWKVGTMKLRDFSDVYNFSFHTDAGDIEARIKNLTLRDLDLGTDVPDMTAGNIYPAANHTFFTIKHPNFYGDRNPDYEGYVNLYNSAESRFYSNELDGGGLNKYNMVPFPFLLYVLDRVFKELGYFGISGDWTTDPNIQRVVMYNDYDLAEMDGGINVYADTITYTNHVPNISVGSFLIDVAMCFGITYKVNPVTRYVEIVKIKDWLNDQGFTNLNYRANQSYKMEPNESDGFLFKMAVPSDDELFDTAPGWLELKQGNGQEEVSTEASTLAMIDETNPNDGDWNIPNVLQTGSGSAFELDPESKTGLRFMLTDGVKQDTMGNDYPSGHYMRTGFSLRWEGTDGIVNRCYSEWMDWKSYTEYMERTVELTLVELLQLDTQRKIMIDNLKWVVDEYDASIKSGEKVNRIKTSLKLYSIKL
ncbi:hypothetical protein DN752_21145 [Echinicola strongylocentroti]|uniref:Uncharacterized protein n=1 Tax=Echinicola strongylocentroti TaxID=1795355 RepID=A0A2Z4INX0_9BACT|nr:hypothetical protein [Echinicola strongylocentroti]AWW32450.1 hypothetical protein DN752_21145 [Echinicola strongylocentroti]